MCHSSFNSSKRRSIFTILWTLIWQKLRNWEYDPLAKFSSASRFIKKSWYFHFVSREALEYLTSHLYRNILTGCLSNISRRNILWAILIVWVKPILAFHKKLWEMLKLFIITHYWNSGTCITCVQPNFVNIWDLKFDKYANSAKPNIHIHKSRSNFTKFNYPQEKTRIWNWIVLFKTKACSVPYQIYGYTMSKY